MFAFKKSLGEWLLRLFRGGKADHHGRKKSWPTREEIARLPWFEGLDADRIAVVSTAEGAKRAYDELAKETVVGFDTESKPTFKKGEASTGPHVAQFSTMDHAYVFTLHDPAVRKVVGSLIKLASLQKVGFGLGDDVKRIRIKLHVEPHNVLDLETLFSARGYGKGVGVKVAVALLFKKQFRKSKRISTSNWMNRELTDQQIHYAAEDVYAAIKVYRKLVKN